MTAVLLLYILQKRDMNRGFIVLPNLNFYTCVRCQCCSSYLTSSHSCHIGIDVMNSGIIEVGWPVVVVGFMKISAWCVCVPGGGGFAWWARLTTHHFSLFA